MNKLLIIPYPTFLLFLFIVNLCVSQNFQINGTIKDLQQLEIPNASIIIYDSENIIGYTYSNIDGFFSINFSKPSTENIKITVSSLGYTTIEKIISTSNIYIIKVDFVLEEKIEKLNEVILKPWEKINVNKDTITFKVSAFKDGSERVVEDLLKNIPGVEISNDGNIKVNGKSIDKLLIEGDDLFDDKYKLLTKNLDADNITEIQILNNFEDNPVLKNFQESEKVALNLKLKEDKKNIWFGNLDVGLGIENRYSSSANIGLLKKKIKLFNLTNTNNVGVTSLSQVSNTNNVNVSSDQANTKIEKQNYEAVNIDNLSSTNFSNNEDIFNDSFLNSLSFTTNLSEKTKLRSVSYFTFDEIRKSNTNITQYFIQPETVSFSEVNSISIKDISFATEFELKHYSSKQAYYTYDFTFETNSTKKQGNLIFNNSDILQFENDKKYNIFNHFNTTKKLSDNKLLLIYAYLGINNTTQDYNIQPNIFYNLFNNDENSIIHQKTNTPLNYYGIVSEIVGKTKSSEYGIELSAQVDKDKIGSRLSFGSGSSIDSLSNNLTFKNSRLNLMGKYSFDLLNSLKIKTSLKTTLSYLNLNGERKALSFINPKIYIHSKKTKIGNFGLSYSFQNNIPKTNYLTENFILQNYRSFNRGIDDIQQTNNHSFALFYSFNNYKQQFLINSFFLHSFSDKNYGQNTTINENTNFNQYQIIDVSRTTNYLFSLTRYINSLSSTIKVGTQQSWSTNPIIINEIQNRVKNYTSNYSIQGTTYFDIPINFKFLFQLNNTKGEFDKQISRNNYIENSLETTIKISKEFLFKLEHNFYSISSNNYFFTNMFLNFNQENSNFSYLLTLNNLSNLKEFKDVQILEFQRNETAYRIIPRYILLNVKYRF